MGRAWGIWTWYRQIDNIHCYLFWIGKKQTLLSSYWRLSTRWPVASSSSSSVLGCAYEIEWCKGRKKKQSWDWTKRKEDENPHRPISCPLLISKVEAALSCNTNVIQTTMCTTLMFLRIETNQTQWSSYWSFSKRWPAASSRSSSVIGGVYITRWCNDRKCGKIQMWKENRKKMRTCTYLVDF